MLAVPLASIGGYAAARRLVASLAPLWMAATYALLPVMAGVVTAGRIGTVVAFVVLPWLVRAAIAMGSPAPANAWRAVFAAGLVLSVMVAFAPICWPLALVAVWLQWAGRSSAAPVSSPVLLRPVVAVVLPVVLLVPWSGRLLMSPGLFLTEAGRVDPATVSIADHAWLLPWGRISAAGDAPWWLSIGLVVAALLALARSDRRPAVLTAWSVIVLGLVTIALLAGQVVTIAGSDDEAFVWLGVPLRAHSGRRDRCRGNCLGRSGPRDPVRDLRLASARCGAERRPRDRGLGARTAVVGRGGTPGQPGTRSVGPAAGVHGRSDAGGVPAADPGDLHRP